jgi:KDO2-lipid IV(A) lauroyltransferase
MIGAIGYYIFYSFNWVITLLPVPVLYVFSDIFYPIVYYIAGYRRKVVRTNLINAFPERSEKDIITIEKKFYRHLCDLFIETFKLTHLSNKHLMRRVRITNPEILDNLYDKGLDVIAIFGHYANWEWMRCLPLYTKLQIVSIYKPVQNKYFDKYLINLRAKNKMILTPMNHVVRDVIENRKNKIKSLYAFIADQTPPREDIKYWTKFLNQDTPVFLGAEKIAAKYDMAVVFFNFNKTKRGNYTCTIELLFEHSAGLPEHLITDTHVRRLEEIIIENPEYWVWSHRRWKYKRELSDA